MFALLICSEVYANMKSLLQISLSAFYFITK